MRCLIVMDVVSDPAVGFKGMVAVTNTARSRIKYGRSEITLFAGGTS